MTPYEIRLRCIEAVAQTGVREPMRLVKDAQELENWVLDAKTAPKKTADKA